MLLKLHERDMKKKQEEFKCQPDRSGQQYQAGPGLVRVLVFVRAGGAFLELHIAL